MSMWRFSWSFLGYLISMQNVAFLGEQEDAKLKRLVAELSLDKLVLKNFASGNF